MERQRRAAPNRNRVGRAHGYLSRADRDRFREGPGATKQTSESYGPGQLKDGPGGVSASRARDPKKRRHPAADESPAENASKEIPTRWSRKSSIESRDRKGPF